MQTTFDFSIDDYLAFQKHSLENSSEFKKQRNRVYVYLLIVYIVSLLLLLGQGERILTGLLSLYFIYWAISFPKKFLKKNLKNAEKMFKGKGFENIFGKHSVNLSEKNLSVQEPGSEWKAAWEQIYALEENEQYFFIRINRIACCVIPKFKIKNLEEVTIFLHEKKKEFGK